MKADDWEGIRFFTAGEAWGDWTKMKRDAVVLTDYIRGIVGYPFIIHCGYSPGTGHSGASQHYEGKADDGHFEGIPFKKAVDIVVAILSKHTVGMVRRIYGEFMDGVDEDVPLASVVGLGIYPHWWTPGFHFDVRGYKARWGAVNVLVGYDNGGKGVYRQTYVSWDEAYRRIR